MLIQCNIEISLRLVVVQLVILHLALVDIPWAIMLSLFAFKRCFESFLCAFYFGEVVISSVVTDKQLVLEHNLLLYFYYLCMHLNFAIGNACKVWLDAHFLSAHTG